MRVRAVVHIHQPRSARSLTQCSVRAKRQTVHGEERSGVVHARGLLAGLERGPLNLQTNDTAEIVHNGIYQNMVSCGSIIPPCASLSVGAAARRTPPTFCTAAPGLTSS